MTKSNSTHTRNFWKASACLSFMVLLQGCATVSTLNLISSPSNLVLVSIHPYSQAAVAYSVGSEVPHPYISHYMLGLADVFPVSSSFRNCTDAYMETKFGRILPRNSAGFTYLFKFTLDSFSFVDSATWTLPTLIASMRTTVTVMQGDSIVGSKGIVATARTTGQAWGDGPNAALTDEAMNRTFIMIEKYLSSIGF